MTHEQETSAERAPVTERSRPGPGRGPWIAVGVAAVVLVVVGLWVVFGMGKRRPRASSSEAPTRRPTLITGSRHEAGVGSGDGGVSDRATAAPGAEAGGRRPPRSVGADAGSAPGERTADGMLRFTGTLVAGKAVITTLREHGVSRKEGFALLAALQGRFDFRKARPGHRYELHLEPRTKAPVYFRYRVGLARVFEVRRAGGGFVGAQVKVDIGRKLLRYGGTVVSSFARALGAQGAHPTLVARIADVLTAQPRFFREQRFGDRFRVVIEEEVVDGKHLRFGPVLALEYVPRRGPALRVFHFDHGGEGSPYHDERGVSMPTSRLHTPVHYLRISSPFGSRMHPVLKRRVDHNGVDMVANAGTPVRACLAGKVLIVGRRGAYGNLVVIDHGDGLHSYYGHLLRFERYVRKGRPVRARRVIGYVGSTGRSTGAHLHWGLKLAGRWIDPLAYRVRPGRPVPARHRGRWKRVLAERQGLLDGTPVEPLRLPGWWLPPLPFGLDLP